MPNSSMKASALIALPKTADVRNILTKIDDIGYFASLDRIEGESVTNFKRRLASTYTRPGNAIQEGLTDGIARELGLGHDALITVTADRSLKLDVTSSQIVVSGDTQYNTVDIITVDSTGFWIKQSVADVISGLNDTVSGITALVGHTDYYPMPAMLLEEQSSWVVKYNEIVPPTTSFKLGYYQYGQEITGKVISGTVSFNDDITFATEISGAPRTAGEWSVDTTANSIRSFSVPPAPVNMTYTHNILESGLTMNLVGNGCRVYNLMDTNIQSMLFRNSGIGETANDFINELRQADKAFWGK